MVVAPGGGGGSSGGGGVSGGSGGGGGEPLLPKAIQAQLDWQGELEKAFDNLSRNLEPLLLARW